MRALPSLGHVLQKAVTHDNFALRIEQPVSLDEVEQAIASVWPRPAGELFPAVDLAALDGLKFSDCLPPELAMETLQARGRDAAAVDRAVTERVRLVTVDRGR